MKLNSEQINEIKRFINSRGFTHIEVEMEIFDHVASAVEEKLEADPNKSTRQAIQEVHQSFGPLGFSVMEDEFANSFGKLMNKEFKSIFKSYLWGRNVMHTLLAFALFFLLGIFLLPVFNGNATAFKIYYYLLGIIVTVVALLTLGTNRRKWQKKSFVMSRITPYTVFAFTICGQLFGIASEFMVNIQGISFSIAVFASFSTMITLYGMINSRLTKWSFGWTNERYLKYA